MDILFSKWIIILMFFVTIAAFATLPDYDRFGRIPVLGFAFSFVYWISLVTFLYIR